MFRRLLNRSGGVDTSPPRPADSDRLYVVGDVHGRIDLLATMLHRIAADFAFRVSDGRQPKVVILGDVIDRGDHSCAVVELLKSAAGPGPLGEVIVLKGNHEDALLRFVAAPDDGADWLRFGGMQTLASYGVPIPAGRPDADARRALALALRAAMGDHLAWLESLPLSYRSGDVLCTHAGIDPEDPAGTDAGVLLWGRARFPEADPVAGLRVVHGHYDAPDPVITDGRICVDTGAYYTGMLTAVRLDDDTGVITATV